MDVLPLTLPQKVVITMKPPIVSVKAVDDSFVPRRAHTKSRGGCSSCKRRRQKCDEAKPRCSRCQKLCFECEYKPTSKRSSAASSPTNTSIEDGTALERTLVLADSPSHELGAAAMMDAVFDSVLDRPQTGQFKKESTAALLDFWLSTHFIEFKPFGDPLKQRQYRIDSIRQSLTRPYLLHCIMALAKINKMTILTPGHQVPDYEAIWYWQRGVTQYHRRLAAGVGADDAGALVSTAAFINGCSFAMITTMDPAQSWPNVVSDDSLSWLKVMKGPQLMLKTFRQYLDLDTKPAPAAAVADKLINKNEYHQMGTDGIPACLVDLFELTAQSTNENNPYHGVCRIIAPYVGGLAVDDADPSLYFALMSVLTTQFTELLEKRDERAMLLLCTWYSIIHAGDVFWAGIRAAVEGKAICMYLSKHSRNSQVLSLLHWPARRFGYALSSASMDDDTLACTILNTCSIM